MSYQSEQQLENILIKQLNTLGFESVIIADTHELEANLKLQLELFNKTSFSDAEFGRILTYLMRGTRFQKAKMLRDRYALMRDNGDTDSIQFFNSNQWCKNEYQVAQQITQTGSYQNRYDVTLLINGLPLVQIELKRRGVEMKEAFNQIQRYQKHSFTGSLFEYTQIFVISNGVNTKYFANNPAQSFEQTFFWTDENNTKIAGLAEFADVFLEKCKVSEMIAKFIVLSESHQIPMILRPYQYYAVRGIVNRVKESDKNGYIWHTTGSGKTLTSFKTSQLLTAIPEISQVIFVVDRKDLDNQTTKEFNSFSAGSVDGTNNTSNLVEQLADPSRKLIVTTIQKLDRAIKHERYKTKLKDAAAQKVVIIFDECHRSQFGDTHKAIKAYFAKAQLFGFTGTPILSENAVGSVTTKDVFDDCLHKYLITHAISDGNVLGFAVEYVGRYTHKSDRVIEADIDADILVPGIDTKGVLESDARIHKISAYIMQDWKVKTKNGRFNAMFATPSIDVLKKYYTKLSAIKPEGFKIATIFSYQANEDLGVEEDTAVDDEGESYTTTTTKEHSRDFLERCIGEYNQDFGTNYSTNTYYDYYKNLQKRIKLKEVDLVLVVGMFLTGFDSKRLNTLYVDKNLQYHGLIQAYSRTNRLLDSTKPHGNIVSFRNLKKATDEALRLFGDENAQDVVFKKPYEEHKIDFEEQVATLKSHVPTVGDVDSLRGDEEKLVFVKVFRNMLRIKASLETYSEFDFGELGISEQEFFDYQSKYLDINEGLKVGAQETASVLDDIDFELELTSRDVINFDYIIQLIAGLKDITSDAIRSKKTEEILALFDRDARLRKKKELIRQFIENQLPLLEDGEHVSEQFDKFWSDERLNTLTKIAEREHIPLASMQHLIDSYLYTQKLPKESQITDMLEVKPKIMERQGIMDRIKAAIQEIAEVFEW